MSGSKLPRPKCLIVDDLKENIIALKSLLNEEEMEVLSAQSGVEALALLLEHDFALALVDVQMPGMDGFELAEIMRSTEKTRTIPLIFVTAASTDSHRIFEGYEKGAVDFLLKPLSPQIVISKVRIFLELYSQKVMLQQKLRKIEETETNLKKALRSRDEFLSICSHELKTPLTSLKMQIQIINRLRDKKGDGVAFSVENMVKFLGQADRSVERIIHLVNDMLDISRVTTGRLSLNLEKVELDKLAGEVIDRLSTFMEMAECNVTLKVEKKVAGLWDKFRIEQVITNLLTNAAKYAPGSPVVVRVYEDGQYGAIDVQDFGPGISKEDQGKIFERFERVSNADSITGLGLGLYISRQISELHHGKLTVQSEPGNGTTFTLKLPLL
ncbi:MAG: ATP-binding protein [Bacteriovoracia bacterium]